MSYINHKIIGCLSALGLSVMVLALLPLALIIGASRKWRAMRRSQIIRHDYDGDEAAYDRDIWKET